MLRLKRKKEHIEKFMKTYQETGLTFKDIRLVNNSLPEVDFDSIDMTTTIGNLKFEVPIMINAITGGSEDVYKINKDLAIISRELNIPMAVGSQSAGVDFPQFDNSYSIAREINKDGIIIANIGANASLEYIKKAIDMIEANALQLHLNPYQELIMDEGDRDFKGILKNIEKVINQVNIPIIVKEVGFGISMECAKLLEGIGVKIVDISGKGGTNFALIENFRSKSKYGMDLMEWGIPTPVTIYEVSKTTNLEIISSGGLSSAMDIVKSIAMGSKAGALAGAILYRLNTIGLNETILYLKNIIKEIRIIMTALGCKNIKEIGRIPIIITGYTASWLKARGLKD